MDKIKDFFEPLLRSYGLPGILILVIIFMLYVAATKPENFKIYFGFLYQTLAWPFKSFRKKAIRYRIEGPTTKALKTISKEIPDIEIPDLVIKWVSEDNLLTKLQEGKAIIKLKFENDNTRNVLKATHIFVRDAFLKHSKPYFSDSFKKAMDLIVTKKLLLQIKNNQSNLVSMFFEENTIDNDEVFEKCEKIEEVDDNGLFTRILLRELNGFGNKLLGRLPKPEHKEESDRFLDFVNEIATRDFDDYTPLSFTNDTLKVGIILVARIETYANYGLEPYLRRIKLGRAKGIESFYLLARSEKVEILSKVAQELFQSGNFILINKPKEFKDSKGRPVVCFYIRINEDSLFASTLREIGDAIKEKSTVRGVVVSVRESAVKLDINGIEGWVKKDNLSIIEINDARMYFKEGTYIEAIPIEIQQNGVVELSLKNTASDPNKVVTSKFEIGKMFFGKISYVDDEFIKVDLGLEKVEGFAYRQDVTRSRFLFLHRKFKIGDEHEFEVLGYNFEKASIRLALTDMPDYWEITNHFPSEKVQFYVCKKSPRAFVGEIEEGVEAILPYPEISWTKESIVERANKIKLDSRIECRIKKVDRADRIVILSLKEYDNNPYFKFLDIHKGEIVDFVIEEITPYGINGSLVNSGLRIYVPKFEMGWSNSKYDYEVQTKKRVSIKAIDHTNSKLIGSFKPVLPHPLKEIHNSYTIGQVLKNMQIQKVNDWGIVYSFNHQKKIYKAILLKKEISNYGWIESCTPFSNCLNGIPLEIKSIDLENNQILLTLRDLTQKNFDRGESLQYENTYQAVVLGKHRNQNKYGILLPKIWTEGLLEFNGTLSPGSYIEVRPSSRTSSELIFLID
ncbi:MAG: 30S ribosomal protein S1 [Sphingobacteriales bacterium]|nr:30S ribosomal protein S1 [Sphingobacteriales bacterium]